MPSSNFSLVIPLIDAQRSKKSGADAANLSKLAEARFSVPRGFVISADACRSHAWASGIRPNMQEDEIAKKTIIESDIPLDIDNAISEAYHKLSLQTGFENPEVIIRPSYLEEYPKNILSYKNISGIEELKTAIKEIWAASFSAEAPAVLVLQAINAEYCGKISTANPTTGNPYEAVISFDVCKNMPESYSCIYDLKALKTIDSNNSSNSSLTNAIIETIIEKSILAEEVLGNRVDISWAFEGDIFWIIKAKFLSGLPQYFPGFENSDTQFRKIVSQPLNHFSRDLLTHQPKQLPKSIDYAIKDKVKLVNGYVYIKSSECKDTITEDINSAGKLITAWDEIVNPIKENTYKIISENLDGYSYTDIINALQTATSDKCTLSCWYESVWTNKAGFVSTLDNMLKEKNADPAIIKTLMLGLDDPVIMRDATLQELGERFAIAESTGKLSDEKWWKSYRADVIEFAREFGYSFKTTGEMYDFSLWKSWIEDIDTIFRLIKVLSGRDKRPTIVTLHTNASAESTKAAEIAANLFSGADRNRFQKTLSLARNWPTKKSECEMLLALNMTSIKIILSEIGKKLVNLGIITSTADVSEFTLNELKDISPNPTDVQRSKLAALVSERKHGIWLEKRLSVPEYSLSVEKQTAQCGTPASSGSVSGKARIVLDIENIIDLENGDILIVEEPMNVWSPLYAVAGGVISKGPLNSCSNLHIAEVYGIPAIVGFSEALNGIKEGQWITLDGFSGNITLGKYSH